MQCSGVLLGFRRARKMCLRSVRSAAKPTSVCRSAGSWLLVGGTWGFYFGKHAGFGGIVEASAIHTNRE